MVSIFLFSFFLLTLVLIMLLLDKLTCGLCKCSKHLVGKVVIVTGGNSGIGYETAKDFAERGARVILGCRNEQRGTAARDKIIAQTGNQDVYFKKLDLASFKSVRNFATDVLKSEKRLDIFINNAAIYGSKNVKTENGLVLGMQTNYFGPFLLTCLLLPLLQSSAPSRIINVSSIGHIGGKVDLDNLNMEKEKDTIFTSVYINKVYFASKLCNILMTVELARRLKGTGVTVNSLHPGAVNTDLLKNIPVVKYFRRLLKPFLRSAWEGAQTSIYLAVSPEVEDVSGYYYVNCRQQPARLSKDMKLAHKLWDVSEKIVNLK